MDRINGAATVDIGGGRRGFRSEDLPGGTEGTEVTDLFLNMVQEEIIKVVEDEGIVLNPADWTQLSQALARRLSRRNSHCWTPVLSMTETDPPGAPAIGDVYLIPAGATDAWAADAGKITEWTGAAWSFATPPNGHGISLPDGRVFERIAGVYVEKIAADVQSGKWLYAVDTGVANALVAVVAPAPAALVAGMVVRVTLANNVTGALTINLNGLGVKPVIFDDGTPILNGQFLAGGILEVVYTGTAWQVMGFARTAAKIAVSEKTTVAFTATGSTTWVVPAGVTRVSARIWGAGGGSGYMPSATSSYAPPGGGGAGAYVEKAFAVQPGDTLTIVVGSGGAGGNGAGGGSTGGASSVATGGVTATAGGGLGGANGNGVGQIANGGFGGSPDGSYDFGVLGDIGIDGFTYTVGGSFKLYGGFGSGAPYGGRDASGGYGNSENGTIPGGGGGSTGGFTYGGRTGGRGEVRLDY